MITATGKTALDLRDTGWKGYHPAPRRADPTISDRRRRALLVAREAGCLLHDKFGATKVSAFGSIVDPKLFTRRSDIDLAVWGVSADLFYRAVAAVAGLSAEFEIDVIDAKTAPVHLRKAIEAESVPV